MTSNTESVRKWRAENKEKYIRSYQEYNKINADRINKQTKKRYHSKYKFDKKYVKKHKEIFKKWKENPENYEKHKQQMREKYRKSKQTNN